jgi:hypothetical protein
VKCEMSGDTGSVLHEHIETEIKFDTVEMFIARTSMVKKAILVNQNCRFLVLLSFC